MTRQWFRPHRAEIADLEQQLLEQQAKLARVVQLQQGAGVDDLTGLPAFTEFQTALRREWDRARRDKGPVSLLELCVDKLQDYNDKHGQAAGDIVLKHVAQTLHTVAHRGGDMVARVLGTRFAAILPNTAEDGALSVARRFRTDIETAGTIQTTDRLTIRVGVATLRPALTSTWDELELEALAQRGLTVAEAEQGDHLVSLSVANLA